MVHECKCTAHHTAYNIFIIFYFLFSTQISHVDDCFRSHRICSSFCRHCRCLPYTLIDLSIAVYDFCVRIQSLSIRNICDSFSLARGVWSVIESASLAFYYRIAFILMIAALLPFLGPRANGGAAESVGGMISSIFENFFRFGYILRQLPNASQEEVK